MTDKPDLTSPEAVERQIKLILRDDHDEDVTVDLIRALSAALKAERASHKTTLDREAAAYARHDAKLDALSAERDALARTLGEWQETAHAMIARAEASDGKLDAVEAERDALKAEKARPPQTIADESKSEGAVNVQQERNLLWTLRTTTRKSSTGPISRPKMVAEFGPNGMARKRSVSNSDLPVSTEGVATPLPLFVVDATGEPDPCKVFRHHTFTIQSFFLR